MKIYEKIGISESEYDTLIRIITSIPQVSETLIYGSRAKGNYKQFSDIDLTLKGNDLNQHDIFLLSEKLEESSLPYLFDLSNYRSITNQSLIDHINRCGIQILPTT